MVHDFSYRYRYRGLYRFLTRFPGARVEDRHRALHERVLLLRAHLFSDRVRFGLLAQHAENHGLPRLGRHGGPRFLGAALAEIIALDSHFPPHHLVGPSLAFGEAGGYEVGVARPAVASGSERKNEGG